MSHRNNDDDYDDDNDDDNNDKKKICFLERKYMHIYFDSYSTEICS